MIKRIISLSLVICMAAALSSCGSEEENSNTRVGGNFITGNIYECGDFKFTISGKYDEDYANDDKTLYRFSDGEDYDDPTIEIKSRTLFYADLKPYLDSIAENTRVFSTGDEDIEITSTDIVTDLDCGYSVGAVHFEFSNDTGESCYYIENETRALFIEAEYELSEKKNICKDVEKLISSVEYISDFKLPTEDTKIDNDYISTTLPKEWFFDGGYESDREEAHYGLTLFKSRAKTEAESGTSVFLMATEKNEKSPEENADISTERFNNLELGSTTRCKYKIFGIESECAKTVNKNSTDLRCYFEHGGLLWTARLSYANEDELADIEDMLSRIELKS